VDKKYAVFIDGDNISSEYLDKIMSEVSKDGIILIKRVYGDWTTSHMNSWKDKIQNFPIRVFQQFRNGPNATDNTIIMDAIELALLNKDVNAFCIVSTDAGYYSLALRLRENGKYVLGIGKEESKIIWQNSCDEFIKIENILKEDVLSNIEPNVSMNHELMEIIEYGLKNSKRNEDGWISFSDFGSIIKAKYPSFDPRTYSSPKLLPLIEKYKNIFHINKDDRFPPNYWLKEKQKKE